MERRTGAVVAGRRPAHGERLSPARGYDPPVRRVGTGVGGGADPLEDHLGQRGATPPPPARRCHRGRRGRGPGRTGEAEVLQPAAAPVPRLARERMTLEPQQVEGHERRLSRPAAGGFESELAEAAPVQAVGRLGATITPSRATSVLPSARPMAAPRGTPVIVALVRQPGNHAPARYHDAAQPLPSGLQRSAFPVASAPSPGFVG